MPINLVQDFSAEIDSFSLLKEYVKLAMKTALVSDQEIAIKVIDYNEKESELYIPSSVNNTKDYLPIIIIEGGYLPKGEQKNSYFNGHAPSVVCKGGLDAIEHIHIVLETQKGGWLAQFWKKCGAGDDIDGSVGVGFKLQTSGQFPQQLVLSFKHIYYHK